MKAISASIVTLAGAVLLAVGSTATGEEQAFNQITGCVVGALGLGVWLNEIRDTFKKET